MLVNATACNAWPDGKLNGSSGLALQAMAWLTYLKAFVLQGAHESDGDHVQIYPNGSDAVNGQ
jgi:hypothetical protein